MNAQIDFDITLPSTWRRIAFMLIYAVIDGIVRTLLWAVILLQTITALVTGKPNRNILDFGRNLSVYIYHIMLFMTFNTETLPFPFSDWNPTTGLQSPEPKTQEPNQE